MLRSEMGRSGGESAEVNMYSRERLMETELQHGKLQKDINCMRDIRPRDHPSSS
jgi:hypothetical protein